MAKVALGGGQAWFVWLIAVSFVLLVFALQTGYAITNVYVASDLSLTLVQVGIVGSIYTWIFALAQFASGSILDKFGARRVLPIAVAFVTAGAFLFANASNVWGLLVAQVFLALGASFGFIGAGFVGGQWFEPAKYGFMFALVQFCASLAAVAGQNIINVAVQDYSWSSILNVLGGFGVLIFFIMLFFLRDPLSPEEARAQNLVWPGLRKFLDELVDDFNTVAGVRDAWVNALIGAATFGCMLALGVVWGPRLMVAAGLDQAVANATVSYSWFGLAIGSPIIAWLSEKWGSRKKPMFVACLLQLCVILIILIAPERSAEEFGVLFFLWGFAAAGSMISFTIGMELADRSHAGTSAALVNATQFIAGGILMAIPGRILAGSGLVAQVAQIEGQAEKTLASFQWALLIYPLALGLALVLFLFLRETYGQEQQGH